MLENTLYKLTKTKELNIAFFGGSITEGAGSSDPSKTSYRAQVLDSFRKSYPDAKINEIYAAIGGTGTSLGVYRFEKEVLSRSPDLIFMEFAVNDNGDEYDSVRIQTEGIFEKVINKTKYTDMITLISTSREICNNFEKGLGFDSRDAQLCAAHKYGMTVFDMGAVLCARYLRSGKPYTDFAPDELHPNDSGYRIFSDGLIDYLRSELDRLSAEEISLVPHKEVSVEDSPLYGADIICAEDMNIIDSKGFSLKESDDGCYPYCLCSYEKGDFLSFSFTGKGFGFKWSGGGVSNDIRVITDGCGEVKARSWDHYLRSFQKMHAAIITTDLEYGEHKVYIENTGIGGEKFVKIDGIFVC